MICPFCGKEISNDNSICQNCGNPINIESDDANRPSEIFDDNSRTDLSANNGEDSKNKKKTNLFLGIAAGILLIVCIIMIPVGNAREKAAYEKKYSSDNLVFEVLSKSNSNGEMISNFEIRLTNNSSMLVCQMKSVMRFYVNDEIVYETELSDTLNLPAGESRTYNLEIAGNPMLYKASLNQIKITNQMKSILYQNLSKGYDNEPEKTIKEATEILDMKDQSSETQPLETQVDNPAPVEEPKDNTIENVDKSNTADVVTTMDKNIEETATEDTEPYGLDYDELHANDYVLGSSDSSYVTTADLEGFSAWDCKVARNEIYARHGRMFSNPELQDYFNSKSWYSGEIPPDSFDDSVLNEYEKENILIIKEYEKSQGFQ